MTFDVRFAVVVLAAFALANAAGCVAALWQWRVVQAPPAPRDRARYLFHLRLLPVVAGLLWAALAMTSFLLFEPRATGERVGVMLPVLGTVTMAAAGSALARVLRAVRRHRRVVGAWLHAATPVAMPGIGLPAFLIESSFPVVAVVGVVRPRLVIARHVLETCTAEELDAVLDHERAHIRHHDNLRRLLLAALPDPMSWLPIGRDMDRAWHDAIEEEADEAPGDARGDAGRVALASALLRLARLTPPGAALTELPASALYRGEPLEQRIRRLLDPVPARPRAPLHRQWAVVGGIIATCLALLGPIHDILEAAVQRLP